MGGTPYSPLPTAVPTPLPVKELTFVKEPSSSPAPHLLMSPQPRALLSPVAFRSNRTPITNQIGTPKGPFFSDIEPEKWAPVSPGSESEDQIEGYTGQQVVSPGDEETLVLLETSLQGSEVVTGHEVKQGKPVVQSSDQDYSVLQSRTKPRVLTFDLVPANPCEAQSALHCSIGDRRVTDCRDKRCHFCPSFDPVYASAYMGR